MKRAQEQTDLARQEIAEKDSRKRGSMEIVQQGKGQSNGGRL